MTVLNVSLQPVVLEKLESLKEQAGLSRSAMLSLMISEYHARNFKRPRGRPAQAAGPATIDSVIKTWNKSPAATRSAHSLAQIAVTAGLPFYSAWMAMARVCQAEGCQLTEADVPEGMWEYRPRALGGTYIKPKDGAAE